MNDILDFKRVEADTPPPPPSDAAAGLLNAVHNVDPGYCAAARERTEQATPATVNGAYASAFMGKVVSVRGIGIKKPAAETPSGTGAAWLANGVGTRLR